jgi:Protein of unknown function (DUF1759)
MNIISKTGLKGEVTRLNNRVSEGKDMSNVFINEALLRVLELLQSTKRFLTDSDAKDIEELLNIEEGPSLMKIYLQQERKTTNTVETKDETDSCPKLARLEIKSFKGEITDWPRFWSLYTAAVHTDSGLHDVLKLQYLFSYLEGAALKAIAHFDLTDSNYSVAIELLRDRYNDPDAAAEELTKKILLMNKKVCRNYLSLESLLSTLKESTLAIDKLSDKYKIRDYWIACWVYMHFDEELKMAYHQKYEGKGKLVWTNVLTFIELQCKYYRLYGTMNLAKVKINEKLLEKQIKMKNKTLSCH